MAPEQLLNDKQTEKQEVKGYFETTGFDRWNRIYSESDDVNKVQRNIRIGHQKTVDEVLAWIKDSGELSEVSFVMPAAAWQPQPAPGRSRSRIHHRQRHFRSDGPGSRPSRL